MDYSNNNFYNTLNESGKIKFTHFFEKQLLTQDCSSCYSTPPPPKLSFLPDVFSSPLATSTLMPSITLNDTSLDLAPTFTSATSFESSSKSLSLTPNLFPSSPVDKDSDINDIFIKNIYIHYFYKNKINETDFANCIKSNQFDFDFKDRVIQFKKESDENYFENVYIFIKNDIPLRGYEPFVATIKNGKWVIHGSSFDNWITLNGEEFEKINKTTKRPLKSIEFTLQTSIVLCENLAFYLLVHKKDKELLPHSNDNNKEVKDPLRPSFSQFKSYCKNDRLLYMFYRLIQADYGFYQHCLHVLEATIGVFLKSCILIPRGSFGSKSGLKECIDLDVDLVIPREILTPEKTKPSQFQSFLKNLNLMITNRNNYMKKFRVTNKEITRSIEYRMKIEDIEILVDLFPKLISENGKLVSLSHEKNGTREWIESDYDIFIKEKKFIMTEEQTAAILFIKLYKKDIKESQSTIDNSYIYLLKAYHLILALEKVVQKYPHLPDDASTIENTFKTETVLKLMIDIVEFLIIAYLKEPVRTSKETKTLPFENYQDNDFIINGCNPYLDDTIDYPQEERCKMIEKLLEFRELLKEYN